MEEVELDHFDMLWLPTHICFWLFARPGHINFHSDIIIIVVFCGTGAWVSEI